MTVPPSLPIFSNELVARIASALVLGLVALAATYEGGWLFALLWLAAGLAVLVEWLTMTRSQPRKRLRLVFGAALCLLAGLYIFKANLVFFVLVLALTCIAGFMLGLSRRHRLWGTVGFLVAAVLVIVPSQVRAHPDFSVVGLLWMFGIVWTTDTAAFFIGRAVGGPKLWPRVSPKKTWSGFVGGLVIGAGTGACIVFYAMKHGFSPPVAMSVVIGVSALASLASQAGDLAESALKRRFNVKDSGRLIPGHGGVMDRLDGFFAVALCAGILLLLG